MFFKKRKRNKVKKRVVCPISVVIGVIKDTIDTDAGNSEIHFLYKGEKHKVGMISDYTHSKGFFDTMFYLDNQEFDSFEKFKSQAFLGGDIFANMTDDVEIIDVDPGIAIFPWYTVFEQYVVD